MRLAESGEFDISDPCRPGGVVLVSATGLASQAGRGASFFVGHAGIVVNALFLFGSLSGVKLGRSLHPSLSEATLFCPAVHKVWFLDEIADGFSGKRHGCGVLSGRIC